MRYWNTYIALVKSNCASSGDFKDLPYWRNNLFAGIIIYLLPLCLIALVPALYWIYVSGQQYIIILIDLLSLAGMGVVGFMPGIKIGVRKLIFVTCIYLFSFAMLYCIGLSGPGLLYLLISCVFSILIFPAPFRFWPAWLNTFICLLFAVGISLGISWPGAEDHVPGEWVAVSANLVFLSFLSSALIPRLFNGLQETVSKEKQLTGEVNKQRQSLQEALKLIRLKNDELEQFAYVASHDLKEPLRMITRFMGVLKNKYGSQLEPQAHTYINFAIDGGSRMQKMIDDLLELSLTARQDSVKEPGNLNDILTEAKQNISRLIEENQAEIIVIADLPVLHVYKADITRLLQNLLSNAIKFRKKEINPVISLNTTENEEEWLFSDR